jgi:hypothetical protein
MFSNLYRLRGLSPGGDGKMAELMEKFGDRLPLLRQA